MSVPIRPLCLSVLVASLLAIAATVSTPAALATDGYVTSFDGTKIVYSFFGDPSLRAGQRAPTVMFGPGYSSGRSGSSDPTVQALLAHGYNVMTWDPRGFGDSGGDVELDSPDFEARDVSALIDRIAQQPQALLDRPGDPRLGMVGASYGGGIQLTSAEIDRRIDVIAPQIAWNSLISSLDKANTAKGGWGSLLTAIGVQGSTTGGITGGAQGQPGGFALGKNQDPRIYKAFADGVSTGEFTSADQAFFASAGPAPLIGLIHIPVLLMQGTDDTLFTLHEAIANAAALHANGVPVQMLWFCGSLSDNPGVAHGQCLTPEGPDPLLTEHFELRWLARYLKRDTSVDIGPGFTWISDTGVEHTTPSYPPRAGTPVTATGSGTLPLVAGDTSGTNIAAARAANAVNVPLVTPPAQTELLGEPTLTVDYSGTATNADDRLYAQIVSNANGLVLGNQVTPIAVTLDGQPHSLTIPLEAVAADVGTASTYTLQITDGTNVYFPARNAGAVTLSHIALSVPTVAPGASAVITGVTPSGATRVASRPFSCARPSGRLAGASLGPVRLGMTRARTRRAFRRADTRGRRTMDFFCPEHRGIRVGYHRGRAVLILTASRHYTMRGLRVGAAVAGFRRRLGPRRLGRGYAVGRNRWYVFAYGRARGVLKVRGGRVQELGIAAVALTRGRRATARFLRSFP